MLFFLGRQDHKLFFKEWYYKYIFSPYYVSVRRFVLEYLFGKEEPSIYEFSLAVILDPFEYSRGLGVHLVVPYNQVPSRCTPNPRKIFVVAGINRNSP
jgi:hypothetical protein